MLEACEAEEMEGIGPALKHLIILLTKINHS